jgi:hypothetical protein
MGKGINLQTEEAEANDRVYIQGENICLEIWMGDCRRHIYQIFIPECQGKEAVMRWHEQLQSKNWITDAMLKRFEVLAEQVQKTAE